MGVVWGRGDKLVSMETVSGVFVAVEINTRLRCGVSGEMGRVGRM